VSDVWFTYVTGALWIVLFAAYGVRVATAGAYRSERVVVPLANVGQLLSTAMLGNRPLVSRPRVPDPSRLVAVALGGGVSMNLPVALYTADSVIADSLRMSRPTPVAERFTANDRGTRLAAVALAWSLFEHFYPYFDVVRTDWPGARDAALRAAATDSTADQFDATIERLIAALRDGHGRVNRLARALATTDLQLTSAEGRVIVTALGDSSTATGVGSKSNMPSWAAVGFSAVE